MVELSYIERLELGIAKREEELTALREDRDRQERAWTTANSDRIAAELKVNALRLDLDAANNGLKYWKGIREENGEARETITALRAANLALRGELAAKKALLEVDTATLARAKSLVREGVGLHAEVCFASNCNYCDRGRFFLAELEGGEG